MNAKELEALQDKCNGLDGFYAVVQQFHKAIKHPDGTGVPSFISSKEKRRRYAWMAEELGEFMSADTTVDQADALGDLLWFVVGTLVCMNIPPSAVMKPITKANMSKIGDDGYVKYRAEDGKVQKPEGWVPPEKEIAANLMILEEKVRGGVITNGE